MKLASLFDCYGNKGLGQSAWPMAAKTTQKIVMGRKPTIADLQ
jgi:hypothetical protein